MILAYAGRREQSLGGDPVALARRIRRLLAALQPGWVVGAAADGADLILLEEALAIPNGPRALVILPTAREVFFDDSVEPEWRHRFEAVLAEVERGRGRVESLDKQPGEAAYRLANQTFLDRAEALAEPDERVVVLVVSRAGEGQMVRDLEERGRLRTIPSLRIDPTVDVAARPKCFVAMPYGRKTDVQRKFDVDCDQVYSKVLVPALENAQLNYRRADEEIDSGVVLEPMIEWLADADLVIGDLGTANFNVGWELGLRHLMRPGQTILIGPKGTTAPFDLAALRHLRYRHDEAGVTDSAAVEAWQALAPFLARVGDEVAHGDSPVAAVMDVRRWAAVSRRSEPDERWERLRQELAVARELRDADLLRRLMDEAAGLDEEKQRLVRAEVGVELVRLGAFDDARPLLHDVVTSDPEVRRPEAHLFYAQALYRPAGASLSDLKQAQDVLTWVLVKKPSQPETRALLGAVAKGRARLIDTADERRAELELALQSYRHDFERNLNLYYEGINVVMLSVVLFLVYGVEEAGERARRVLPAVRVAAGLAVDRPDERFWATATLAECVLHEHFLDPSTGVEDVRAAYAAAARLAPRAGDLSSSLTQLAFLERVGLPGEPLSAARAGLLG